MDKNTRVNTFKTLEEKCQPKKTEQDSLLSRNTDKSTFLLSMKVEGYIKSGDKNQNYYGLIRQAIFELNYNVIDCTDEILFETNTVSDLKKVEKLIINYEEI